MVDANEVKKLIKKYFGEKNDHSSLSIDQGILPEDMDDFLEEYVKKFNVNIENLKLNLYFPNAGLWFLPNFILPKFLQTEKQKPESLKVEMLIKSAEAGQWL